MSNINFITNIISNQNNSNIVSKRFCVENKPLIKRNIPSLINQSLKKVPIDQLENVIIALNISFELQFEALTKMRNMAHAEGVLQEDGQNFFYKQYGTDPNKQMIAFIKEFRMLPTEVLDDKNIKKAFVNQGFINAWNEIENSDSKTKTKLNLLNKKLHRLPKNIGKLIVLTELYLSENKLISLPTEIGKCTALKILYLSDNQLTSLPAEIGQLINLVFLYLQNNHLTSLPVEIGSLRNLRTLYLSKNKLTELPKEICQLTAVTNLYLSKNQLTSIPDGFFQKLQNLLHITISKSMDISKAGIRSKARINRA